MKILLTSHRFYPDIGGIESVSSVLADFFTRSGHSVRLVTQTLSESASDRHYPYRILRCPPPSQLLACYHWADVILQNNLEVRQLWPLFFLRKPLVIGLQTWIRSIHGQRGYFQISKLLLLRFARVVIACSQELRQDTFPRALVIGNPFNNHLFRVVDDVPRQKAIAFLGRLVSDKGVDMLLRAYASLNSCDWSLSILGDGPERADLEALAAQLNIAEKVVFHGSLSGEPLVDALNHHEILVVSSRWREPFGVVALEGLACGCVVLASDGGGLPDAVGPAGLLFRRGDQDSLNARLHQLVQDDALRHHLRAQAASHLKAFYQEVVGEQYLTALTQVCPSAHL